MARFKDGNWNLEATGNGCIKTWEQAGIAVLMDIRDELKALNGIIGCRNVMDVPQILREIRRNTTKRRKPRKAKTA